MILLYKLAQVENGAKVTALLKKLNLPFKELGEEALDETVGSLAELSNYDKAMPTVNTVEWKDFSKEETTLPAIVFSGFGDAELTTLLTSLSRDGAQIRLKAIVTSHNKNWSFGRLLEENGKEDKLFAALKRLNKLIEFVEGSGYTGPAKAVLAHAKSLLEELSSEDKQPRLTTEEITAELLESANELEAIVVGKK